MESLELLTGGGVPTISSSIKDSAKERNSYAEPKRYKIYPQLLAGFIANLAMFNAGLAFGWPASALPKLQQPGIKYPLTSDQGAWVVSAMSMGACFGPILSGFLINRIGRKWFLYATGVPYLICWTIVYFTGQFEALFVARFTCGVGVGAAFSAVPIYVGEIAETKIRGSLGTMNAMLTVCGTLMSYAVGPWVDRETLALVSMIPTILFLLIFMWMPETPYYYLKKQKTAAAEKSLSWLRSSGVIKEEIREMSDLIELEERHRGRISELITVRANRRATLIVGLMLSAQQFCGIVAVMAYVTLLFESMSLGIDSSLAVIITGLMSCLGNLIATCIVDRIGRRPLLLISLCITSVSLTIIGVFFHLEALHFDVTSFSWIPLIGVLSYCISVSLGLGPIPYAVLGEIYPTTIKAWATMFASIYGSLLGFAVAKIFQVVSDAMGRHVIFYGFVGCEIIIGIFIYFIMPETKQKPLKEIQAILDGTYEEPVKK
ncbi:hypothetical protein KM043_017114 [Ampulex compressa]|nr:hypothetical protein KM043_017114 [Ampulex compressa]